MNVPLGAPPGYPEETEAKLRAYAESKGLTLAEVYIETNAGRAPLFDRVQGKLLCHPRRTGRGDTVILPALEEVFWTARDLDAGLAWVREHEIILHVIRFGAHTLDGSTPAGQVALATLIDYLTVRRGMARAVLREARAQREILEP